MIGRSLNLRRMPTVLAAMIVAASVAGCGKTLVFAERDGVNFAVRANATSAPPIEANFGLNRTIATIVPPAGEAGNRPDGDAVSMLASFQIDNTLDPAKAPLKADLEISTQFASGQVATVIAKKPKLAVAIVNPSAGAQLAAQVDAEVEVIIAAISCGGKMDFTLRDKLIDAAGLDPGSNRRLKTRETPGEFTAAIQDAPSLVSLLHTAAVKQGRATCPNQ
jgi:hypothetical protein